MIIVFSTLGALILAFAARFFFHAINRAKREKEAREAFKKMIYFDSIKKEDIASNSREKTSTEIILDSMTILSSEDEFPIEMNNPNVFLCQNDIRIISGHKFLIVKPSLLDRDKIKQNLNFIIDELKKESIIK